MTSVSAATRLIALLGDPVAHSLSPVFQNAAIQAAGFDAVYLGMRTPATLLPNMLRGIAMAGGAGNVTVPHKAAAARSVDTPTAAVEATGACNTFWLEGDRVCGDNTDVTGFLRAAASVLGHEVNGGRVLVLGAGGSASAVVCGLVQAGCRTVITNRTRSRAEQLADRFNEARHRPEVADLRELRGESFDLVVNATTLGLRPDDPAPLDPGADIRFTAALDLVYKPERTAWVRSLREDGLRADDGLEMLIQQGAAAFERWFGQPPDLAAIRASLPPRAE